MSIYICKICEQQKDSDFNCAELDGKECCEQCYSETLEKNVYVSENAVQTLSFRKMENGKWQPIETAPNDESGEIKIDNY